MGLHAVVGAMSAATTPAGDLLRRAADIVEGARRTSYGQPERAFNTIAAYWTIYLQQRGALPANRSIRPEDVARMMELLKIGRGNGEDDCLDAAGYAALAHEVQG